MIEVSPRWKPLGRNDLGFLNTLSDLFASAEHRNPDIFTHLRNAKCLFVGSDYGGEHRVARYQTLSFLISDISECASWSHSRQRVRNVLLRDSRRLAFKNLNDRVRGRALTAFLDFANNLRGVLITFVVHKSVQSLFVERGTLDVSGLNSTPLSGLSAPIAEKTLRVIHLLSLLLAGFSAAGQDVLWASDNDSIAANESRLRSLVDAVARISSHILPHDLGNLRVATAKQDPGDLSLEDLLSIPDLSAGALSNVMEAMFGNHGALDAPFHLPRPERVSVKVRRIMNWFSDNTQPLKRTVILIDEKSSKLRATHIRFHGTNDLREASATAINLGE